MSEPVARRVIVHGTVQGVFFRQATLQRAESRGVRGWVRNNDDGTVEALFEGDAESVDAMVEFVHEGPRAAQVKHVDVEDAQPEGHDGFEAR